jgi:hypothetical protein
MEELDWLKKKAGELSEDAKKEFNELADKAKVKYNEMTTKATNAKLEDDLASKFNEDEFVKHVLAGTIKFNHLEKKHIKTLMEDYYIDPWHSVHEYFELNIINKQGSFYVEFKINHSIYNLTNVFRLNNVIRYGKDSTEAEAGLSIKKF